VSDFVEIVVFWPLFWFVMLLIVWGSLFGFEGDNRG
jgi:hypothetical protein